jgi:hypothetical protein
MSNSNVKMNVKCKTVSLCLNEITQNTTFQFCTLLNGPSVGTAWDNEVILVTSEAWHGIYGKYCEYQLTSSKYFVGHIRTNKRDMHTDAHGTITYLNGNQKIGTSRAMASLPRRHDFSPRSVYMRFVFGEVAPWEVLLQVQLFPTGMWFH